MYYQKAREYALKRLQEELPANLYYHGVHHTLDVCQVAEELAACEQIPESDLPLLSTAAIYHDIGFIEQYQDNELIATRIARETLPAFDYTPKQIDIICQIILATRIPHNPHTLLEKIICDADLDYLGRPDFFDIAGTLQQEWKEFGLVTTDYEWNCKQVRFFQLHRYFTGTAIKWRNRQKQEHLAQIQKLILANNNNA